MRQDAIEHLASGGVGVETAVDEIADATAGLRSAPGVGFLNCPEACGILVPILEKAHKIAHRRMAEPEHQRVTAGIDQLINPARFKAGRDVNMRVRRDDSVLGALIVEADPALTRAKRQFSGGTGIRGSSG